MALSAVLGLSGSLVWALRHRRSSAVRTWQRSKLPPATTSPLFARASGSGDRVVILLHGLVSTGDVFGEAFDVLGNNNTVVVPDLLGFGRSLDGGRSSFSTENHREALDELATQLDIWGRQWVIGAHSMGSALALSWAYRHPQQVERVVCWGAPMYESPEDARARISGSPMTRLFTLDTDVAERTCAISCRHRQAAGWLTAALQPNLPVPISRSVSHHTWPAYRDAMNHLVIETNWENQLAQLDQQAIPIDLTWGTEDRVGDHRFARTLAAQFERVALTWLPDADHHLPMTHPELCLSQLTPGSREVSGEVEPTVVDHVC